jgi:peptide-methionine (S)-S-oxide reductase
MQASEPAAAKTESLVLGGGCFWCLEAAYKLLPGVKAVVSGYAGGHTADPSYKQVCTGITGHAEVVRIEYDPAVVTLERLLEFFWQAHDPTTLNRQGDDVGTQYRSIILYRNAAQRDAAEKSLRVAQEGFDSLIVTQILPLETFWRAEEYHQGYFEKNPSQGYCSYVIRPKIDKLKKKLGGR